ncbi:MAG TPA: hypothetical protein VF027_00740 [Sphingomicrobium sp.]
MDEPVLDDWRVTEGPGIGIEPLFELSQIHLNANFFVTGGMSRNMLALLSTKTPTRVESIDRTLPEMEGLIRIYSDLPERAFTHLFGRGYDSFELYSQRGVLALVPPDRFAVHLYLPAMQYDLLLPMLARASRAMLRIEIERTLDQGLLDDQTHFWNDRMSPIILFNEFEINVLPEGWPDDHGEETP